MKLSQVKKETAEFILKNETATPPEIHFKTKIALVQIYAVLKFFTDQGALTMTPKENNRIYSIKNKEKLLQLMKEESNQLPSKKDEPKIGPVKPKGKTEGRDLTKYSFNGEKNLSKGRLAHAIVSAYAKQRRPSLKQALELFPETIVAPYGFIRERKEALKLSKERPRFFCKPEEAIKLKDAIVAVSNQMTSERIGKIIQIARKELKYTIK